MWNSWLYLFCCLWLVTGGENSDETYWSKYILRYMKCQSPKGPPVPTDASVSCLWLQVDDCFCRRRRSIGKSSTLSPPSAIDLLTVLRIFDLRRTSSMRILTHTSLWTSIQSQIYSSMKAICMYLQSLRWWKASERVVSKITYVSSYITDVLS